MVVRTNEIKIVCHLDEEAKNEGIFVYYGICLCIGVLLCYHCSSELEGNLWLIQKIDR